MCGCTCSSVTSLQLYLHVFNKALWYLTGVYVMLDNIWVMFMNVVSCSSVLSSTNDFDEVGTMISCMYYSCHSVLSLFNTETDCPAYSGAFLWQPVQSWLAAFWVVLSSNLSKFSCCMGIFCLILCGTVVHRAHWYSILAGDCRWESTGVLLYVNKVRYGSCPEHLAWVSRPWLQILQILRFLGEDVLCLMFKPFVNSAKRWLTN